MTADQLTVGSLCTGYGGLDLALKAHFNTRVIWTSEIDKHASRVVKARYRAPNLGDLKLIDWATTPSPDIITAGYPCQPFSYAGGRNGTEDPRHIWPWIAEGIRHLRPRLAVMENVQGHLTKGFGEVIGTLAEMGYDATWGCVRASDAGAPHRRERVFIVATDTEGVHGDGRLSPHGPPERRAARLQGQAGAGRGTADDAVKLLPTPTVQQGRNATSGRTNPDSEHHDGWTLNDVAYADRWGDYAPAIARWEHVLGRPAPAPVDGKGRLSPVFVEWMMGLPAGWVTDHGLLRTAELKMLGNGVVPQAAAIAWCALGGSTETGAQPECG